jgi:tRNA pseudouridine55 synthase
MTSARLDGLLVLDKPAGMTSRATVNRAQGWFPRGARIGHAGTLDPLATGVLVLCIGNATRLVEYVQRMDKAYDAGLRLGVCSDTDDADGTVTRVEVNRPPDRDIVAAHLQKFIGDIDQVPPLFSAAKVTGRRAYELARRGHDAALAPRRVRIDAIDLKRYSYPHLDIEVRCGKGTYIRALARDLGKQLGCGALIESLRRTRIGPFDVAGAVPLEIDTNTARARLRPLAEAVCQLPTVRLDSPALGRLTQGQIVPFPDVGFAARQAGEIDVAVFDERGRLAGVAIYDFARRHLRPDKVLHALP